MNGIVFLVGSCGLVFISRKSLLRPRSHGFFRFFAWEAILALILLNVSAWFKDPLAPHQIVSWLFLVTSACLVAAGVVLLRGIGRPDRNRRDDELLAFEKTSSLVTTGLYRYIRHPLYASLLFLAWGTFLKRPAWLGLPLALFATLFLFLTAKADESECRAHFGEAYSAYMGKSKRFIPYLF